MCAREDTEARLWATIEPVVVAEGFELVDLQYIRSGRSAQLRLFVDKPEGGITINECAELSRLISPVLDVENLISVRYFLEVSSPGLNRVLRKPKDFERFAGKKVKLTTTEPLNGRRNFSGELRGIRGEAVVILSGSDEFEVPLPAIHKAHLDVTGEL